MINAKSLFDVIRNLKHVMQLSSVTTSQPKRQAEAFLDKLYLATMIANSIFVYFENMKKRAVFYGQKETSYTYCYTH